MLLSESISELHLNNPQVFTRGVESGYAHYSSQRNVPLLKSDSPFTFSLWFFYVFLLGIGFLPKIAFSQQDSAKGWTYHFQLTAVLQSHPPFHSAYSGMNSMGDSAQSALSLTTTLFLGRKLWKGAAFYVNPEVAGGTGLSNTLGIAAFPNGETFRIGDPEPEVYVARAFIKQHIALGNSGTDSLKDDQNQFEELVPRRRLDITFGKLALSDLLDDNAVSHDPRTDFLNWALMNNGAWDYAANTRGYTYLLALEFISDSWALRFAEALEPTFANGPYLNFQVQKTQSENLELTKNILLNGLPGHIRLLGFMNNTQGPSYQSVLQAKADGTDTSLDITNGTTYGHIKYGGGLNIDQQFNESVSGFLRVGWDNGQTATWAFASIDQTLSGGIKIGGKSWERAGDEIGLAGVLDGISAEHRAFLNAGGYDFMIGDGRLTNYGPEGILELFYQTVFFKTLFLTADYQFVSHPAYNLDRGPVQVFTLRTHVAF